MPPLPGSRSPSPAPAVAEALVWYDPSWLYRQKITIEHTLVAEDLTDFPLLITDAVVQANLSIR